MCEINTSHHRHDKLGLLMLTLHRNILSKNAGSQVQGFPSCALSQPSKFWVVRDNWVTAITRAALLYMHSSAELHSASAWLRVCGHSTMYTVCMQICSTLSANTVCVYKHSCRPREVLHGYLCRLAESKCTYTWHEHRSQGVDWIHLGIWSALLRNFKDKYVRMTCADWVSPCSHSARHFCKEV